MGESLADWKKQAQGGPWRSSSGEREMLTVRRPRPIVPTNLDIVIVGRDIADSEAEYRVLLFLSLL